MLTVVPASAPQDPATESLVLGSSMDYEVFLLSHIREEQLAGAPLLDRSLARPTTRTPPPRGRSPARHHLDPIGASS